MKTPDEMIIHNDCFQEIKKMSDSSIDLIVTDPPYALNFMGKDWDNEIPGIEIWKECLRICKPGSWMACFGGTRTFHRMTCLIEESGWKIRDCICWLYGSGFPKGKGCLKPAWEPIILCRKNGSNPKLNIDECRIEGKKRNTHSDGNHTGNNKIYFPIGRGFMGKDNSGRWPSNLILNEESAEMLDQMTENNPSRFFYCAKSSTRERNVGLEGMPFKNKGALDGAKFDNTLKGPGNALHPDKNSKMQNFHPTVKPLSLMRYIIKLIAPNGDPLLLDPFVGSGSTCIASLQLGIRSIGIEKNAEYCEIARKRIESIGKFK